MTTAPGRPDPCGRAPTREDHAGIVRTLMTLHKCRRPKRPLHEPTIACGDRTALDRSQTDVTQGRRQVSTAALVLRCSLTILGEPLHAWGGSSLLDHGRLHHAQINIAPVVRQRGAARRVHRPLLQNPPRRRFPDRVAERGGNHPRALQPGDPGHRRHPGQPRRHLRHQRGRSEFLEAQFRTSPVAQPGGRGARADRRAAPGSKRARARIGPGRDCGRAVAAWRPSHVW
jgi:hypothetical protein